MIFGHSRISKRNDQNAALQHRAFEQAQINSIFFEATSGGRWELV